MSQIPASNHPFPGSIHSGTKVMYFIDGEWLAIRYSKVNPSGGSHSHVYWEPEVAIWTEYLNMPLHRNCEIIRRYYYTCCHGDEQKRNEVIASLKEKGIEAPRVFSKSKGAKSKQVDIQLCVDMLSHAHRGNFDIAVLVAGDGDYVPLVDAVQREGCRVAVWSMEDGLSPALAKQADWLFDLTKILYSDEDWLRAHNYG